LVLEECILAIGIYREAGVLNKNIKNTRLLSSVASEGSDSEVLDSKELASEGHQTMRNEDYEGHVILVVF